MTPSRWYFKVSLTSLSILMVLMVSCSPPLPGGFPGAGSSSADSSIAASMSRSEILQESWQAYKRQFIQADGRVIDREANDRTVSEGQAYAMLRAVLIDDPETFSKTLEWAESNLQRRTSDGQPSDALWAWKWGEDANGNWGVLDPNFASDADLDAITALILAARRWNRPDYLTLAQTKLDDLWNLSTMRVPATAQRYLLPGPAESFVQPDRLILNPSYLAPYAFRLFAQVDSRDWLSLVDSSYQVLNEAASLSSQGLPGDWVVLNLGTRRLEATSADETEPSIYGFDAYRVWWRVALDAVWFEADQAQAFLQTHLQPLRYQWQAEQKIPAQMDLQGEAIVPYESTAQYGMLYAAFSLVDPAVAAEIQQQKLLPTYRRGIWDSNDAYYTQNLCWFGLAFPYDAIADWLNAEE
ncbi:glycosyl hydrolase family 8 [Egbenema bharatensis]|uniref:glycosyl hydrolase family 8 n=1 Tax=Egbenema bharatensis TaxID=3463334 RepID=UPI003A8A9E64